VFDLTWGCFAVSFVGDAKLEWRSFLRQHAYFSSRFVRMQNAYVRSESLKNVVPRPPHIQTHLQIGLIFGHLIVF